MAQTRDARLITKRTSVPGKIPTGTTGNELNYIKSGELASNLADHTLWGYDGTDVFEYGSNSFLGLTGGTISGDLFVNGSLSANTLFSGSTDVETIIYNILAGAPSGDITRVQPGTNITTGGTANSPIINLDNNIVITSVNATTLSGGTIYSGATDLSNIFGTLSIQQTLQAQMPTKADLSGATFTGAISAPSLSATTISGGTFYGDGSGLTNLPASSASSAYRTFRLTGGTTYTFTDFSLVNTLSINKIVGSSTTVVLNQTPVINEFFVVKDAKGDSKTNPITISGGTYNIDGNTAVELKAKNNPSLTFLFDGTEYIII